MGMISAPNQKEPENNSPAGIITMLSPPYKASIQIVSYRLAE